MGGCNSCEATAVAAVGEAASSSAAATAKVVSGDGSLQEFAAPTRARHVLQKVGAGAGGGGGGGFALCSADDVELGERVAAVGLDEELQPGQLYFLLPAGMLRRCLLAEDMAELALRASSALVGHNGPLVFPSHVDVRPNKQDNTILAARRTRRSGGGGGGGGSSSGGAGANRRDFASQLTAIEE